MRHNRYYYPFYLIFLVFLRVHTAYPQEVQLISFNRGDFGLHLEYPSLFAPAKANSSQVLLLLHPKEARFPTFNMLVQPGNPHIEEKTLLELKADVVDSYRGVGLYDAEVRFGERRTIAGRTVYFAKVFYLLDKIPLTAGVYIIPGHDRYYACTFVATEGQYDQDEVYLNTIINTLTLQEPAPPPPSTTEPHTALFWFAVIFGVLLCGKAVQVMIKKSDALR